MSEKEAKLLIENEQLKASFLSLQNKLEQITVCSLSLQNKLDEVNDSFEKSKLENDELKFEIQRLEELLRLFKLMKFGIKKDNVAPGQMSIFDELEMEIAIQELTEKIEVKTHTIAVKKSKNLVNDDHNLPVEIVEHDVENKNCPKCSNEMLLLNL